MPSRKLVTKESMKRIKVGIEVIMKKPKHYILTEKEMNKLLKSTWIAGRQSGKHVSYQPIEHRYEASSVFYRLAYGCKFGQKLIDIEAGCIMRILRKYGRKRTVKITSFIIKIMNYMKDALADARVILYKDEEL